MDLKEEFALFDKLKKSPIQQKYGQTANKLSRKIFKLQQAHGSQTEIDALQKQLDPITKKMDANLTRLVKQVRKQFNDNV
ncbi:hypothetical protein MOO44_01095 (plasmid) [Nicoliella spurrieriana]|uniref:Uncharacterized protein n=1 Tax=Nicoliella spurrieriana TaxID=2925830 RepID=A0A976RQH1_9LACO|nr:hypothetical protein [Nicoliella spurrieriana]UQS85946.1 hypothetical protein MOO44_01095 [Nicoliella spurrieriana]